MQIEKCVWTEKSGWSPTVPGRFNGHAQLVFIFGSHATFQKNALIEQIKAAYPEAILFGWPNSRKRCFSVRRWLALEPLCFPH